MRPFEQPAGGSPDNPVKWVEDNTVNPFLNAALILPLRTVTENCNAATKAAANCKLLPEVELLEVQQARVNSTEYWAQSLCGGLGAVIPYVVAGRLASAGLRAGGRGLLAKGIITHEGPAARILASHRVSSVVGATAYDGARPLNEGETRLGNAAGGAVAFSMLEAGNSLTVKCRLPLRLAFLPLTGAASCAAHQVATDAISHKRTPTYDEVRQAAISGAAMNVALPFAQKALVRTLAHFSRMWGKDMAVQDAVARGASPTLDRLVDGSTLTDVNLSGEDVSHADIRRNRAIIVPGADVAEAAHELAHGYAARRFEPMFRAAAEILRTGDSGHSRQEAYECYREARLRCELYARIEEARVLDELGIKRDVELNPERIPELKVVDRTYEQIWRQDFEKFVKTGGDSRPDIEFTLPHEKSNTRARRLYEDMKAAYKVLDPIQFDAAACQKMGFRFPARVQCLVSELEGLLALFDDASARNLTRDATYEAYVKKAETLRKQISSATTKPELLWGNDQRQTDGQALLGAGQMPMPSPRRALWQAERQYQQATPQKSSLQEAPGADQVKARVKSVEAEEAKARHADRVEASGAKAGHEEVVETAAAKTRRAQILKSLHEKELIDTEETSTKLSRESVRVETLEFVHSLLSSRAGSEQVKAGDFGHDYELKVEAALKQALRFDPDWIYCRAEPHSVADGLSVDGVFVNVSTGDVAFVDWAGGRRTATTKVLDRKGIWAMHIPEADLADPQKTLKHVRHFLSGSSSRNRLGQAIRQGGEELAIGLRIRAAEWKRDKILAGINDDRLTEDVNKAFRTFVNCVSAGLGQQQRAFDILLRGNMPNGVRGALYSVCRNEHLDEYVKVHLRKSGRSLKGIERIEELRERTLVNFIKGALPARADVETFLRMDFVPEVAAVLGMHAEGSDIRLPMFGIHELAVGHADLSGERIPLPLLASNPLSHAYASTQLIAGLETYLTRHPEDGRAKYLLERARASDKTRRAETQLSATTVAGLIASAAERAGGWTGEVVDWSKFPVRADSRGTYRSLPVTSGIFDGIAVGRYASDLAEVRFYNDGSIRGVRYEYANGERAERTVEIGNLNTWLQVASEIAQGKGVDRVVLESISGQPRPGESRHQSDFRLLVDALTSGARAHKDKVGAQALDWLRESGLLEGRNRGERGPAEKTSDLEAARVYCSVGQALAWQPRKQFGMSPYAGASTSGFAAGRQRELPQWVPRTSGSLSVA